MAHAHRWAGLGARSHAFGFLQTKPTQNKILSAQYSVYVCDFGELECEFISLLMVDHIIL